MTALRPTLDVLIGDPDRQRIAPDDAESRLTRHYAPPAGGRWLRANMISTVDGAATGRDGRSGSINGPADLRAFTVLRALADVVLVGAGTVRTEGYRAPRTADGLVAGRRARGQGDHPALAVVTRDGDLPVELLADPRPPRVFTTAAAEGLDRLRAHLPPDHLVVQEPRHGDDEGRVDLRRAVATLVDSGLGRILTEGGPTLLAGLAADDLLDELCLTTSPLLVGGTAPRVLGGPEWLDPGRRLALTHLLHADGVLLGRWRLERR